MRPRRRSERVRPGRRNARASSSRAPRDGDGAPPTRPSARSFVRSFILALVDPSDARVRDDPSRSIVASRFTQTTNILFTTSFSSSTLRRRRAPRAPRASTASTPASGLVPVFVVYANPNANPPVSAIFPNRSWFLSSSVSSPIARRRPSPSSSSRADAASRQRIESSRFARVRRRVARPRRARVARAFASRFVARRRVSSRRRRPSASSCRGESTTRAPSIGASRVVFRVALFAPCACIRTFGRDVARRIEDGIS